MPFKVSVITAASTTTSSYTLCPDHMPVTAVNALCI